MKKYIENKDAVVWIRGIANNIDDLEELKKEFEVEYKEDLETKKISFSPSDIVFSELRERGGLFQIVYRKDKKISPSFYPDSANISIDFTKISTKLIVKKIFVRTGIDKDIRILEIE